MANCIPRDCISCQFCSSCNSYYGGEDCKFIVEINEPFLKKVFNFFARKRK